MQFHSFFQWPHVLLVKAVALMSKFKYNRNSLMFINYPLCLFIHCLLVFYRRHTCSLNEKCNCAKLPFLLFMLVYSKNSGIKSNSSCSPSLFKVILPKILFSSSCSPTMPPHSQKAPLLWLPNGALTSIKQPSDRMILPAPIYQVH